MVALIRYELANRPKIKMKDVWWKRRERKQNNDNNNKQTLSEKKEDAGNVSKQRHKGSIHLIRVHGTIHCGRADAHETTPHKERLSGLVKHWDCPPHSSIVNERYDLKNKRANKEKNRVPGKNRSRAQPQTLTQGGHEISSLLN